MPISNCRLCLHKKELQDSHVLPNALFKRLFRKNEGKAIHFNDDSDTLVRYSSESWSEYLFCKECEELLNEQYEQKSIALLRNSLRSVKITKHKTGISFENLDQNTLQLFMVSILWRAAISNHHAFDKVYLPGTLQEEIRASLLSNTKVRSSLIGIKVSRLYDRTNGFTLLSLKDLIISPFFRDHGNRFSFCFLFDGFFIEMFVPGLRINKRHMIGVINPNSSVLYTPYLHIFDIPELLQIMVSGYGKHVEGKSKIRS